MVDCSSVSTPVPSFFLPKPRIFFPFVNRLVSCSSAGPLSCMRGVAGAVPSVAFAGLALMVALESSVQMLTRSATRDGYKSVVSVFASEMVQEVVGGGAQSLAAKDTVPGFKWG